MEITIPKWLKTTRGKIILGVIISIIALTTSYLVIKAATKPILSSGCTTREHYDIRDGVPHITCFGKYIEDLIAWNRIYPLTVVGGYLCEDQPATWGFVPCDVYYGSTIYCPSTVRGGCSLVIFDEDYNYLKEIPLSPGRGGDVSRCQYYEIYYCDIDCICSDWIYGSCAEQMCTTTEVYKSRTCPAECESITEACEYRPTCTVPVEYCGNGVCGAGETQDNCPADCGAPPGEVCTLSLVDCDDGNPCTYNTVNYETCTCVSMPREGSLTGCSGVEGCKQYLCRVGVCKLEDIPYCVITQCGNNKCDPDENYLICPTDCPDPCSGMQCPDKCGTEGYYLLNNGECTVISGVPQCKYTREACPYGCDSTSIKCIEPGPDCLNDNNCDDANQCTTDQCVDGLCHHYEIEGCGIINPTACTEGELNVFGKCTTITNFVIIIIIILSIISLITYLLLRMKK